MLPKYDPSISTSPPGRGPGVHVEDRLLRRLRLPISHGPRQHVQRSYRRLEPLGVIGHYAQQNLALQATVAEKDQALIAKDAVIADAMPKVEAYDTFLNSEGHYGLQNAARAIGAPPNSFVAWLKSDGFLFYQSGSLVPKAPFLKLGVFVVRAAVGDLGAQSFITPYGLTYLSKSWERHLLKTKGPGPGSASGSPQASLFEAA